MEKQGFTKEQCESIGKLWARMDEKNRSAYYGQFLRFFETAHFAFGDCVMVPWCGMVIGIESDGYTHS